MFAALLVVALSSAPASASASASAPPQAPAPQAALMPAYRSACIGSLREFAYALSSAVESGDVNRLAELYRWQGLSTQAGYEAMARLQEIVARPLLEVAPLYPQPRELEAGLAEAGGAQSGDAASSSAAGASGGASSAAGRSAAEPPVYPPLTGPPMFEVPLPAGAPAIADADPLDAPAAPPGPALPRPPPVALRIDQTLANGVTPATTTLRLQRELGCWWVSL